MSSAPIVDRIRIIPRPNDFLDRNVGSSGEVFFNKATNSLRVYSGKDISGFEIARADLTNVDTSNLNITNDDINWIPYATLDDLPSATNNHGMFAHVHSEGRGYFAHAGQWVALANVSDLAGAGGGGASVDVGVNPPSSPTEGNLWLNTESGKLYIYINDGDSEQWIQPAMPTFSGDYNDLTNLPSSIGSINDLSDVDTSTTPPTSGQVLKWDGEKWAPAADVTTGGGGSDADTLDGQDGTYYLDYNNFTNLPSTFDSISFTGPTTFTQTTEVVTNLTNATGTVVHDLSSSAVFNHTSLTGNFIANFTNAATTNNRTISIALVLNQGVTPYMPLGVQIDGVTQTINWLGASVPSGSGNQINIVSFTLIRTGASWTVIGSSNSYG